MWWKLLSRQRKMAKLACLGVEPVSLRYHQAERNYLEKLAAGLIHHTSVVGKGINFWRKALSWTDLLSPLDDEGKKDLLRTHPWTQNQLNKLLHLLQKKEGDGREHQETERAVHSVLSRRACPGWRVLSVSFWDLDLFLLMYSRSLYRLRRCVSWPCIIYGLLYIKYIRNVSGSVCNE